MKHLRIVDGNTFATSHLIKAVDAQGQEIQDFDLQVCTDIKVYYEYKGNYFPVYLWSIDDQRLNIVWKGPSMRLGIYNLYIKGKFHETDWRIADWYTFEIVKYNKDAYIPDDVTILNGTYFVGADFALITLINGGGGGTPSSTMPLMDGVAQVGEENAYARGDHRHPSDTNKQDLIDDLAEIRSGAAAGQTAYQMPTNGIPSTDMEQSVQDALRDAESAVQPSAIADMATQTYVNGKVGDETTRAESAEGNLQQALHLIEDVIPAAASSSNQLADKDFVNHSIATNTATFKGTYNSLAELQQQTATNNDYAFVIETDSVGNEYYDRYKYNGSAWLFEYKVESTPFTASQWAAIQSGITSALVTKIGTALQPTDIIDSLSSASTTAALSANQGKVLNDTKQPLIDNAHKLSADLVDDTSTTNKFVTASEKTTWNGKADKVLVVNHGTDDTTYSVTPNTLHIWGTVASLTLTLATPTDNTIVNEYMIEFTSGSTATTLSLPSSVEWAESCGALSVEANKTYQISIVNNIGLWAAISNS